MQSTIIPFPLFTRMRAANDDGPDGPAGNAVSPRLQERLAQRLTLQGVSLDTLAQAA